LSFSAFRVALAPERLRARAPVHVLIPEARILLAQPSGKGPDQLLEFVVLRLEQREVMRAVALLVILPL